MTADFSLSLGVSIELVLHGETMSLSSALHLSPQLHLSSLPRLSPEGNRTHVPHRLARHLHRFDEGSRARRAATAMNAASPSSSPSSSSDQPFRPPQEQQLTEIRVCTNKACRRQGAEAIAKLSSDLSLPGVITVKCGCLGVCGAGPNVAFLPQQVIASHVATPARFLSALETVAGVAVSPALMRATTLRLQGNTLAREGDLRGAERVYTAALEGGGGGGGEEPGSFPSRATSGASAVASSSSPSPAPLLRQPAPEGARHLLYCNRSGVRLALGDARGALSDAEAAVAGGRGRWATALVRLAEARAALGDAEGAAEALRAAREADPGVEEAVSRRKAKKR